MELLGKLKAILARVEAELGVRLTDDDFAAGREEIEHILLHEACHAAVANRAPWVRDLPEEQHTAMDEVVARLVEDSLATQLGLLAHTPEEHVKELLRYPIEITVEQYEHLRTQWQQHYGPYQDLSGMANYVLKYFFC
jgi:hypothetical protein